jgi:hypothetical protein
MYMRHIVLLTCILHTCTKKTPCSHALSDDVILRNSENGKVFGKSLFEKKRGPKPRFQGTSVSLEKPDLAR